MPFRKPKPREPMSEAELLDYAAAALGRRMRTVAELKKLMRARVEDSTEGEAKIGRVIARMEEMRYLSDPRFPGGKPLELLFGQTIFFWLILIFSGTFLTMRLISEERGSGTIEMLMTFPVRDWEVVAGKYLAALGMFAVGLLLSLPFAFTVAALGPLDWGPV